MLVFLTHHPRVPDHFTSPLPKNPGSLDDNNNKNKNNRYLCFVLPVFSHTGVSMQEYVNVREVVCKSKGGHGIP